MPRGGLRIEFQDPRDGRLLHSWEAGMAVGALVFSADGRVLFGKKFNGNSVVAWDAADGKRLGEAMASDSRFGLMAVSPDGRRVATAGSDQVISLLDAPSLAVRTTLRGHEDGIRSLAFSPDGKWLASGGNDHSTRLWNLARGTVAGVHPPRTGPSAAGDGLSAAGPAGIWVGGGKRRAVIALRDRTDGHLIQRIPGPPGIYLRLIASPDGKRLAAFAWPRDLYIAGLPEGKWGEPWKLSDGTVGPIVFSPDGRWLASGGDDNAVSVREACGGRLQAVLRGHREQVLALAFSPDGRTLASSAADGALRLWHLPTWRELGILHEGERLTALEFDREGRELSATGEGGVTRCFPARE